MIGGGTASLPPQGSGAECREGVGGWGCKAVYDYVEK